jgi:hypothetical protein
VDPLSSQCSLLDPLGFFSALSSIPLVSSVLSPRSPWAPSRGSRPACFSTLLDPPLGASRGSRPAFVRESIDILCWSAEHGSAPRPYVHVRTPRAPALETAVVNQSFHDALSASAAVATVAAAIVIVLFCARPPTAGNNKDKMFRREQQWLEKHVHHASLVSDVYDARGNVPLPHGAHHASGGPVAALLRLFPADQVRALRTIDLSQTKESSNGSYHHSTDGLRRADVRDAASLQLSSSSSNSSNSGHQPLHGESCADLIEQLQVLQLQGRVAVETVDLSGAGFERVAFLVVKHFLCRCQHLRTLRISRSRLTPTQFGDLLDCLQQQQQQQQQTQQQQQQPQEDHGVLGADAVVPPLDTLDVSDCPRDSLPLRALADFLARSTTLKTLVLDGAHVAAEDARQLLRGLMQVCV